METSSIGSKQDHLTVDVAIPIIAAQVHPWDTEPWLDPLGHQSSDDLGGHHGDFLAI